MNLTNCIEEIRSDRVRNLFAKLYGTQNYVIEKQQQRYERAVQSFHEFFPTRTDIKIYSAPGRTEIGGNHTDHQRGIVLAGAVEKANVQLLKTQNMTDDDVPAVYGNV